MTKQIDRAAGGLSADAGGSIDSVTKAQVERLGQSVDQMEGSLEDLRRASNTKLAEQKATLEESADGKLEQLKRLFEKLLADA